MTPSTDRMRRRPKQRKCCRCLKYSEGLMLPYGQYFQQQWIHPKCLKEIAK